MCPLFKILPAVVVHPRRTVTRVGRLFPARESGRPTESEHLDKGCVKFETSSLVWREMALQIECSRVTYWDLRLMRANVPVILSSGYSEQEVTSLFVGKGLAGFIQKPFRLAGLKAKIKEVLHDR